MRFKIDWASLIVGSKFTVLALFYLVFEGNFPSTSPQGAYIWRGDLTEGFLRYQFGGLLFGAAYTLTAYFRNFTVCISQNHHFFSDLKIRLRDRDTVDLRGLEDETIFCLLCFLV